MAMAPTLVLYIPFISNDILQRQALMNLTIFSFEKEHFSMIVEVLQTDFPSGGDAAGRGAISPESRVGLFLAFCAGGDKLVRNFPVPSSVPELSYHSSKYPFGLTWTIEIAA